MTFSVLHWRMRIAQSIRESDGLQYIAQNFQSWGEKEPSCRGTGPSRNTPPGLKDRAERGGSLQEDIGEEHSKPEAEFHSHSREDQG